MTTYYAALRPCGCQTDFVTDARESVKRLFLARFAAKGWHIETVSREQAFSHVHDDCPICRPAKHERRRNDRRGLAKRGVLCDNMGACQGKKFVRHVPICYS